FCIAIAVAITLSIAFVHCVCQNFTWHQSRHPVLLG
ncbi:hypothetical protein A2U01_0112221, partial [Trifolium medium]|nr:hypothetical protein [Trifolium medium]